MPFLTLDYSSNVPGGIGHCFFDIMTVLILSKYFGMTPLLRPISCHSDYTHGMDKSMVSKDRKEVLSCLALEKHPAFKEAFPETIPIKKLLLPHRRFSFIPLRFFRDAFGLFKKEFGDKPYIVAIGKNHRVSPHLAMSFMDVEGKIMKPLREFHSFESSFASDKGKGKILQVALSLRRGDLSTQPLSIKPYLDQITQPYHLHVTSAGSECQMKEIKTFYSSLGLSHLSFYLNSPLKEVFEVVLGADIKFLWEGGMHRVLGWYSNPSTVVVYKPSHMPRYQISNERYPQWHHWLPYKEFSWEACENILKRSYK